MKKNLLFFMVISFFNFVYSSEKKDIIESKKFLVTSVVHATALTAYSAKIAVAQLIGDRDQEKRLQFCLWETQNFILELKKVDANSEEQKRRIAEKFAAQIDVCNKLISKIW